MPHWIILPDLEIDASQIVAVDFRTPAHVTIVVPGGMIVLDEPSSAVFLEYWEERQMNVEIRRLEVETKKIRKKRKS